MEIQNDFNTLNKAQSDDLKINEVNKEVLTGDKPQRTSRRSKINA